MLTVASGWTLRNVRREEKKENITLFLGWADLLDVSPRGMFSGMRYRTVEEEPGVGCFGSLDWEWESSRQKGASLVSLRSRLPQRHHRAFILSLLQGLRPSHLLSPSVRFNAWPCLLHPNPRIPRYKHVWCYC